MKLSNSALIEDLVTATDPRYREFLDLPRRAALAPADLRKLSREDLEGAHEAMRLEVIEADRARRSA